MVEPGTGASQYPHHMGKERPGKRAVYVDVYKRQHRLCTRGGMLESFLQEPERLTDDDVMLLLKLIFHRQDTVSYTHLDVYKRQELYALLLDRSTLSQKNGWQDSEGRTYIVYPLSLIHI